MKHIYLFTYMMTICAMSFGQSIFDINSVGFKTAYDTYPAVPEGMLEAMAWYHSHGVNLKPTENCTGIPTGFGLFNLIENGKGFFQRSAFRVEKWSGIPLNNMKEDVASQIMAMSGAYSFLIDSLQIDPTKIESHFIIVKALSTIPDGSSALQFARSSEAYQIS